MRATVTGADGFVGQWLIRRLLEIDIAVTGWFRGEMPALTTLSKDLGSRVDWRRADLADLPLIRDLLADAQPDLVFHLAAQSFVPASIEDPVGTFEINAVGTARVLEACRHCAPAAKVLIVGSADAYGSVPADRMPLREDMPLQPNNPYSASKAAAEVIALQYAHAGWTQVVVTRSFNHTGPGQSTHFAVASFAKQISDIKRGKQSPTMRTGSLSPRKDYCDVRDVVEAYISLVTRGQSGSVYNVCSGRDHSMRAIVEQLLKLGDVQADVIEDPALVRKVETPLLVGDPTCIQRDTGWRPKIELSQTLSDMLNFYMHG